MLAMPITASLGRTNHWSAALAAGRLRSWWPSRRWQSNFAPTAFTDHLYVTLALAALVLATERAPAGRGASCWASPSPPSTRAPSSCRWPLHLARSPAGADRTTCAWPPASSCHCSLVAGWELARSGGFSLFSTQLDNVGGLRLAWSWELGPRVRGWAQLAGYLFGARWWSLLLLLLAGAAPLLLPQRQAALRLFWLFGVAYGAAHWLLAVPIWDRYYLPLVAPGALLATAAAVALSGKLRRRFARRRATLWQAAALLLGALWLAGSGAALLQARAGGYPLGATPRSDGGAAQLAAYLDDAPWGTVLYDHWQSWQWRYYFLNRPVYVHWFPDPADLAADLAVHGREGPDRYLAVPERIDAAPLLRAVREVGYDLALEATFRPPDRADGVLLYRVIATDE